MLSNSANELEREHDWFYQALVGLRNGGSRNGVAAEIQGAGADMATARRLVEEAYDNLLQRQAEQRPSGRQRIHACAGASVGALLGALLWWQVLVLTGYEISLMALVVGWLAGWGTALGAGQQRGRLLQGAAVLAAVLGIVLGNFLNFVHLFRQMAHAQTGVLAEKAMAVEMPVLFLAASVS